MASLQVPLNKLQLKEVDFIWTTEFQESFETLKGSLPNEYLRRLPNPNEPFALHTDSSAYAIGGVLMLNDTNGQ